MNKKIEKCLIRGIVFVQSTLGNIIITVSDLKGNTRTWSSSGSLGFKGSKKSTNYAAHAVAENVAKKAMECGIKCCDVKYKGIGFGRDSSLQGLKTGGLIIRTLQDVTPTPHGGCKQRKKKRI